MSSTNVSTEGVKAAEASDYLFRRTSRATGRDAVEALSAFRVSRGANSARGNLGKLFYRP